MRLDLFDARERSLVVLRWGRLESFGNDMRVTFRHPLELVATSVGTRRITGYGICTGSQELAVSNHPRKR